MTQAIERLSGDNLKRLFPNLIGANQKVFYYPGWKEILVHACADLEKTGVEIYEITCQRGRLEVVPCECKHLGLAAKKTITKIITRVGAETSKTCALCGKLRSGRTLKCSTCAKA